MPTARRRSQERSRKLQPPPTVIAFLRDVQCKASVVTDEIMGAQCPPLRLKSAPLRKWLEDRARENVGQEGARPIATGEVILNPKATRQIARVPFPHAAIRWLINSGRLGDLMQCPTCQSFFIADHRRRQYCGRTCSRPSKEAHAAYMSEYRQLPAVKLRARRSENR